MSHRRPQESGFTPGRSTCDRIATLCNIAQRRQVFGHPTFAAFVDLRAAFDSLIIIIIIIIINEKINVAFSRRTARTRNSHKKTQAAKTSCLIVQKKKK